VPIADDIEPRSERIQSLIDFARREGWHVCRTPGRQTQFTNPGYAPIYSRAPSSDANERREDREASLGVAYDVPPGFPDSSAATGNDRPKEVRHA